MREFIVYLDRPRALVCLESQFKTLVELEELVYGSMTAATRLDVGRYRGLELEELKHLIRKNASKIYTLLVL